MELSLLPFHSALDLYQRQAEELLSAHQAGDARALRVFHENHPRFLDPNIVWLPRRLAESEIREAALGIADSQLALARWYCFENWAALAEFAGAVTQNDSPVYRFESAIEAVIAGDLAMLKSLLRKRPELIRARSIRVTPFDPPVHRAALLHYLAANGVEGYRQKTPDNAVEIARTLLEADADVDALADLYGGQCTTMSLLVSSSPPAKAGLQVALIDTLADFGAALDARGSGNWVSPVITALAFGFGEAAEALVRRGAAVDSLAAAAGLGRLDDAVRLLPAATPDNRHRALALAAQLGRVQIVRLLVEAGEDPDRYNPEGTHAHSTPLHQAVIAGRGEVVRFLVERGVKLDIKDTIYQGTPLGWANHAGQIEIAEYLRSRGAKTAEELAP